MKSATFAISALALAASSAAHPLREPRGDSYAQTNSWSDASALNSSQGWADYSSSSTAPSSTKGWVDYSSSSAPTPRSTQRWSDYSSSSTTSSSTKGWADYSSYSAAPSSRQAAWSDQPAATTTSGWTDASPSSAPSQSWADHLSASSSQGSWSDTAAPSSTSSISASTPAYTLYFNTYWQGNQDRDTIQRYTRTSDANGSIQVTLQKDDLLGFVEVKDAADNANCVAKDAQGNHVRAFGGPDQPVDQATFDKASGKQAASISCSLAK